MKNFRLLIKILLFLLVISLSGSVYAQNPQQTNEKRDQAQTRRPPRPPQIDADARKKQMATMKYQTAIQSENSGRNERAFEILAELVNDYPRNSQYFEALVRNMIALNLVEETQKVIEERLTKAYNDDNPDWLRAQLGMIFYNQGNTEKAELEWELCLNTYPGSSKPYRTLFYQFLRMRDIERAEAIVQRGRKDLSDPTLFALNMANLYQSRMSWSEALDENLLALSENFQNREQVIRNFANFPTDSSTSSIVINNINDELLRYEELKEPWSGYKRSLKEILVNQYTQKGDYVNALKELDQLDSLSNANGQKLLDFAIELQGEGEYETAIESLRLARKRSTNKYTNEQIDYTLALFSIDKEEYAKADSILTDLTASRRKEVRATAFLKRGELRLEHLNRTEDALSDFNEAVEISSDDQYVGAILGKAKALIFLESYDEADEVLLKLFEPILNMGRTSSRGIRQKFPIMPGTELAFEVGMLRTRLSLWQNDIDNTFLMLDSLLSQPKGSYSENDAIILNQTLKYSLQDSTIFPELGMADLLIYKNNLDSALTIYDSLISKGIDKLTIYLKWQKILINIHHGNTETVNLVEDFIAAYPEHALSEQALLVLGEFWEKKEELDKARETYENLIINYPDGLLVSEARLRLDILTGTENIYIIPLEDIQE